MCTRYFHHCCNQIADRKQYREGRTYFGSQCQFIVVGRHARGSMASAGGVWCCLCTDEQGRKEKEECHHVASFLLFPLLLSVTQPWDANVHMQLWSLSSISPLKKSPHWGGRDGAEGKKHGLFYQRTQI